MMCEKLLWQTTHAIVNVCVLVISVNLLCLYCVVIIWQVFNALGQ